MGCQNCFQVSRGDFRRKLSYWKQIVGNDSFFLDFGHKNFGLLTKNFRWVRQNCIQFVQSRFLSELFFYEFFQLLDCFPTVGGTFCNIVSKTLENLLQLHSTWTTKVFEENLFPEKNAYFYNFFELWSKILRTFVESHSTRFQKLISTFVRGFFLHIIIIFLYAYSARNFAYY